MSVVWKEGTMNALVGAAIAKGAEVPMEVGLSPTKGRNMWWYGL